MHYNSEWFQYLQQLQANQQSQYMRMAEMAQLIQQLVEEVNQLKKKGTEPPVIRNEYKFDLLKIERLEGTLNIGLNPNGEGSTIDEFAVDQTMEVPPVPQEQTEWSQGIQNQIFNYLDQDAYRTLQRLEQEQNYPLDDSYRKFIIDDVKRQIPQRIQHYLSKINAQRIQEDQRPSLENEVIRKVRQDIDKTFEIFIKNLPRKGIKPQ